MLRYLTPAPLLRAPWDEFSRDRNLAARQDDSAPRIDIWEEERAFQVAMDVPGLKQEDLEILVLGDQPTVSGRREDRVPEGARVHRRERVSGGFRRVLLLPASVDSGNVAAALTDGVLRLTLPKGERARSRKIEVKSA